MKWKFIAALLILNILLFCAFALVVNESRLRYSHTQNSVTELEKKIDFLKSKLEKTDAVSKTRKKNVDQLFSKFSNKIHVVEESLDPSNTRWSKIKLVRDAVQDTIERFRYPKHMSTLQITTYASSVVDNAEKFDVPIPLVLSMTRRESAFNPRAKSHVGATGLIQIIPSTAREIAGDLNIRHYSMYKIRDNVKFGVYYIMKMLDEFDGDMGLAVRAYNCGPTYVHKVVAGDYKDYPEETREYVKKILGTEKEEGYFQFYEKMGL